MHPRPGWLQPGAPAVDARGVARSIPRIELRPDGLEALERELDESLSHGRAFVPGAASLPQRSACRLVVRHPVDGSTIELDAEVVWVVEEGDGRGVGVMLTGFDREQSRRLDGFVAQGALESKRSTNVMERVRGFSTAEQMRRARDGELTERVALERVYGKAVWEGLLSNQRISPPEVARIARKGGLPKPLVELITSNPAWVASPEIRRALLTNPRVAGAALDRVLAPCSRKDLELIATQLVYPMGTRQAARRKLKR